MSIFEISVTLKEQSKPFVIVDNDVRRKIRTEQKELSLDNLLKYDPVFVSKPRSDCVLTGLDRHLASERTAFLGFLIEKKQTSKNAATLIISTELDIAMPADRFHMFYIQINNEFYFKRSGTTSENPNVSAMAGNITLHNASELPNESIPKTQEVYEKKPWLTSLGLCFAESNVYFLSTMTYSTKR